MPKNKFYQTDGFKSLKAAWDVKLDESGFRDIEKGESEYIVSPQVFHTKEDEYHTLDNQRLCEEILLNYDFRRPVDRKIFELHTQGKSIREIEEYLQYNSIRKLKKTQISDLLMRVKENYLKR
jgi:hypothetical protein